jgi:hypothetical protein
VAALKESFRIVTVGVQEGQARDAVGQNLAALFKCRTRDVAALLAGEGVSVKRGLALSEAARYRQALEQCGLLTAIVPERAGAVPVQVPKTFMPGPNAPTPVFQLDARHVGVIGAARGLLGALLSFTLMAIAAHSAMRMGHGVLFYATCVAVIVFSVLGVGCVIRLAIWWRQ